MNLNWGNSFSIGIESVDSQYKELFNRINLLLFAVENGKGKDEVIETLNLLEEYVIKHFTDEEEIQKNNNYPKYSIQHKQHDEFKEELKELRKVFETTGVSALLAIRTYNKKYQTGEKVTSRA